MGKAKKGINVEKTQQALKKTKIIKKRKEEKRKKKKRKTPKNYKSTI